MIVEKLNNYKITISFSGKVGKTGLKQIKSYIEFLEKNATHKKTKVAQSVINKLADEVTDAAWKRLKKSKGL